MKVKGSATLVGYRQGPKKDGTVWRMVTLLSDGDTLRAFCSDDVQLNGEVERISGGELIPCTATLRIREKGRSASVEVVDLDFGSKK